MSVGGHHANDVAFPLEERAVQVRARFVKNMGFTRYGKTEDVADLVTFLVSERATWMHGATIDLDGGEIAVL